MWWPAASALKTAFKGYDPSFKGYDPSMAPTREERLIETFVELADTLVDDFDVIDFLHMLTRRATELLDAVEAGLLLADSAGHLQLMASSSERTRALELFQLQNEEGPCLDCYRTGVPVISEDLDAERDRWPQFVAEAGKDGFVSVHAVPLRLRQDVIGALGIFGATTGRLSEADLMASQGMAHIATISLLHQRAIGEAHTNTTQLQFALNSRVIIEQAKGVLAERAGIGMDEAFQTLRQYARAHNERLSAVADGVVNRAIQIAELVPRNP
jgi:transcriptional regulator with GAF, ATPase, and Fis domain